jgi:hypothetical protein
MKVKRHIGARTALLLLAGLVTVTHARVYWRWGAAADSDRTLEAAGGKMAYQAEVNVNGGRGRVTVFAFDSLVGDVKRELGQAFGTTFAGSGATMAMATVKKSGHVIRLIAVQLGDRFQTLVMKFDQTAAEHKKTGDRPKEHLMSEVPAYPGSEPAFYAANDDTKTGLAVSDAAGSPDDVQRYYASHLKSEGWQRQVSTDAPPGQAFSSMRIYQQGPRICCVHAIQSPQTGHTRITLLHKRHEVK